ncbi:hypothetical protein AAHH78_38205, partial [Burkholderia pseudomallei]
PAARRAPPLLGEHTDAGLRDMLGSGAAASAALRDTRVVCARRAAGRPPACRASPVARGAPPAS